MNKKKIAAAIISIFIIGMGIITANYIFNKNKENKLVSTPIKTVKTEPKISQAGIDINLIPVEQRGLSNYKEEIQNINGQEFKVMTGTYSRDINTGYSWLGGKQISPPQFSNCISTSDKSAFNLSKKQNAKNVTIMVLGKNAEYNASTCYEIIQYSGPYSASANISGNSNKYTQNFGKVLLSDSTGITLDDGKKYNISKAPFIQMMNNDRAKTREDNLSNKFLKSYDSKDFPKNTVVIITYKNNALYSVGRFCIIK